MIEKKDAKTKIFWLLKTCLLIGLLTVLPMASRLLAGQQFHASSAWTPAELKAQHWFDSRINKDEKILWSCAVSPDCSGDEAVGPASVGVAISLAGLLILNIALAVGGQFEDIYVDGAKIFARLVIAFGVIASSGPYWAYFHALDSACVLTDHRAVKFSETGITSLPYDSANILETFQLTGKQPCQKLGFCWPNGFSRAANGRNYVMGFEHISDGETALKILTEQTDVARKKAEEMRAHNHPSY